MSFNLKQQTIAQLNIKDQSSLDAYIQMLITQLGSVNAMPTAEALSRITDLNSLTNYGIESFEELQNIIRQQMGLLEQQEDIQNNLTVPELSPESSVLLTPTSKGKNKMIKPFNLKNAQMPVPFGPDDFNETSELGEEQYMSQQNLEPSKKFETHADLNESLIKISNIKNAFQIAWGEIQLENPQEPDAAQAALKRYFQGFDKNGAEQRLADASVIYSLIYGAEEPVAYEAEYKAIGSSVNETSEIIKKIAQKVINKNKKKSYNLTKIAQHKSLDNAILWGPGQSRIDPFLHQPVSDWHIVERNKGFGLVVDDIWNIDYETIWRENIMDKYSRPYKNNNGDWVGGYIQKRFEVDKNIPETSNIQLKPGQKRKPILPEYGNTESRLQDARAKGNIAGAIDTSKPFNWKEASKKKS